MQPDRFTLLEGAVLLMSARMRAGLAVAVALVGVGAASCRGGEERAERVPSAEEAMASPAPEGRSTTEQIGDAEIAAIVVAANGIDVRFGELAREHAVNPGVQQFAEAMITAHTAVNENAGDTAQLGEAQRWERSTDGGCWRAPAWPD